MAATKTTTNHQEIKRWVEGHGGHPATVKRTRSKDDVGLLRIDFPGFSGEGSLAPVEWDEWLRKFDEQELAFVYQEGKKTNFNKLVRRDAEKVRPSDRRRGPSRTTRGGRAAARALAAEGRPRAARSSKRAASTSSRSKSSRSASSRSATPRGAASGKSAGPARQANSRRRSGQRRAAQNGRRDLSNLTKVELYELARSAGLANRAAMNKSELVRALERRQR